ncbi:GNAT family N-acetyltransferase [Actinoplanes sp. CA-142083]|uniref:GNAT family N-acetyltransferase n=1 Tax=Actinoplanes sp. CA-142083 TaxID=3239903 RepID=UPI003D8B7E16
MGQALGEILDAAAEGRFPPDDGETIVVPQPSWRDAGVVAFTGHSVVFVDEDPAWVKAALDDVETDPLAAAMNARFLNALLERTGRRMDTIDLLTVAQPLAGPPPVELAEIRDPSHPRVRRALLHRDDVRVWATAAGAAYVPVDADDPEERAGGGLLVLGRGVAGRWEAAIEVESAARHRGLGKALALAARHLVPGGLPVWSQQAAGNARSIRAFQAAGYRPVGGEALMVPR